MSKLKIIDKKSEKSINSEREFLSKLHHPFIVNMHYAFQDKDNLYLVMDMLSGGDLRYHISRYKKFSEEQTRFFIACMVLALGYIHSNKVLHRDIKPENLVLEQNGYLRITDFGIAKENCKDNSSETSGTPGYMSPEVMKGKNHSYPVDFFAIGVIGYEFMIGKRPYYGKSRSQIKEAMFSTQAEITESMLQKGWSPESADFINKLLIRKADLRLGKNGAIDLMEHSWLKYYPWEDLENKTLPAPFIPEERDNFDKRYCELPDKISEETRLRYEDILAGKAIKKVFIHFYYNKEEKQNKNSINVNKQEFHSNIISSDINKLLSSRNAYSSYNNSSKNILNEKDYNSVKIYENEKKENNIKISNYNSLQPASVKKSNIINMKIPFPQFSSTSKSTNIIKHIECKRSSRSKGSFQHSRSTCNIQDKMRGNSNRKDNNYNSNSRLNNKSEIGNCSTNDQNINIYHKKSESSKLNNNYKNIISSVRVSKYNIKSKNNNYRSINKDSKSKVRSSSAINYKTNKDKINNKIYDSNYNNKTGLIPHSQIQNHQIKYKRDNCGDNKRLSRVQSATKLLNRSSLDYNNGKTINLNKKYKQNYIFKAL